MFHDLNMNSTIQLKFRKKTLFIALAVVLFLFLALAALFFILFRTNDVFHPLFHEESLSSGQKVKVTMMALVWGGRPGEDGCTMGGDCFHLEFVSNDPNAELPKRTAEAQQVFELIRPPSEQWGFTNAEVLGFKQLERTGDYDLFEFDQGTNGNWSCTQKTMSVFAK
jgi:hypothetical protein